MHTTKARFAGIITALASLTFVGAALAQEPGDPELAEEETPLECPDTGADVAEDGEDATAEDVVDGSSDEATGEDGDEGDATEGDAIEGDPAEGCEDTVGDDVVVDDGLTPPVVEEEPEVAEVVKEPAPAVEGEWENHGAYVSEQARVACWEPSEEFANHGECVREAARSDVGKPAAEDDGEDESVEDESVEDEATEVDDAPAAKGKGAGKGRGKG
jgi:hypothetical protein